MKKAFIVLFMLALSWEAYPQSTRRTVFDHADFLIEPLPFNTVGSDISPYFIDDNLFYTSVREEYFNKTRLERLNKAFYNVYSVVLNDKGEAISPRRLVAGFGGKFHEGPLSYCKSTGEMFVTHSNTENPDTLDSFFPSVAIKLKIVVMEDVNGVWQVTGEMPFNDKNFNFAHPAISITGDTLVFASDIEGKGFGKVDLYMSTRRNGEWSEIVNLGERINTPGNEMFPSFGPGGILLFSSDGLGGYGKLDLFYTFLSSNGPPRNLGNIINTLHDDFGLVIHPSGDFGFFSSDRPGKGRDDIYRLDFLRKSFLVRGKVVDQHSNLAIKNARVNMSLCGDSKLGTTFTDDSGGFEFTVTVNDCLQAAASADGYLADSITSNNLATPFLIKLKPDCGIDVLVLEYGTDLPVANASVTVGETSLSEKNNGSTFGFTLPCDREYNVSVSAADYLNFTGVVRSAANGRYRETVYLTPKTLEKSFVLNNIYYNYGRWELSDEAKKELDKIVRLLKDNPDIEIEISSHTDSRSSASFNMNLSRKRATTARDYIISQGIGPKRIHAAWYGKTRLLNHCDEGVQCSEEEHLKNRRTEFAIKKINTTSDKETGVKENPPMAVLGVRDEKKGNSASGSGSEGWHLIVASFEARPPAEKQVEELRKDGFPDAKVIEANEGYFRIAVGSSGNYREIEKQLKGVKHKFPGAWLLKTNI